MKNGRGVVKTRPPSVNNFLWGGINHAIKRSVQIFADDAFRREDL
jgi:hypothetical protein